VSDDLRYLPVQASCDIRRKHNQTSGLDQFEDFLMPLIVSKVDPLRTPVTIGGVHFTGPSNRQHGAYFTEYIRQVTFSAYSAYASPGSESVIVLPE